MAYVCLTNAAFWLVLSVGLVLVECVGQPHEAPNKRFPMAMQVSSSVTFDAGDNQCKLPPRFNRTHYMFKLSTIHTRSHADLCLHKVPVDVKTHLVSVNLTKYISSQYVHLVQVEVPGSILDDHSCT